MSETAVIDKHYLYSACPNCSNPPWRYVYHNGSPCPRTTAIIRIVCTDNPEHNRIIIAPIEREGNKETITFDKQSICKYCNVNIDTKGVYNG